MSTHPDPSYDTKHALTLSVAGLKIDLHPPETTFSVGEAVEKIASLQNALQSIEDFRLKLKWCLGFVIVHTNRPRGIGTVVIGEIVERVRNEHGIRTSRHDVYRCERLYRHFSGDFNRFMAWIEERKSLYDRPVYWSDVLDDVLGGRNNPDVIGPEAAARNDLFDVERSIDKLEKIVERAYLGHEESAGAIVAVRQSTEGIRILEKEISSREVQNSPLRNEEYLTFVRAHGCLICRMPADAHHAFGRRGAGIKPSDYACIPLCRNHHLELHAHGRETFFKLHNVDALEVAFNLFHCFVTGRWVSMQLDEVPSRSV